MATAENMPTVKDAPNFDKDADCQILRKAMKGLGTDEKALVDILCNRSNDQRQELAKHYKASLGRDLIKDLKSEVSGDFEELMLGLMDPLPIFDAKCLKKAMKGTGTDEKVLLEILCARTNLQIKQIKVAYKVAGLGQDLEQDLSKETSGHLKRLLVGLCAGARDESTDVDEGKVVADAKALLQAGLGRLGTDESEFQRILAAKSIHHLRAVFNAYALIAKETIVDTIKNEMSGDLMQGYLNIISYIKHPHEYFADTLYKAMKGLGTDEKRLIRIIVTRSEIDLGNIAFVFHARYKKTFTEFVGSEVSGDFRRALLALIK